MTGSPTPSSRSGSGPRTRRRTKPALSEEQRRKLLARETQECGPATLALRVAVVAEVKNHGDWKALAGALDDVAAAAIKWRARVEADATRKAL